MDIRSSPYYPYGWVRTLKYKPSLPGLRSRPCQEGMTVANWMVPLLWCHTGRKCLLSALWHLPWLSYWKVGNAVHGAVSHWRHCAAEFPEGRCWEKLLVAGLLAITICRSLVLEKPSCRRLLSNSSVLCLQSVTVLTSCHLTRKRVFIGPTSIFTESENWILRW